ncbi:MAG: hypothetical protein R2813_09345 [Flavobacteriales bacterium]
MKSLCLVALLFLVSSIGYSQEFDSDAFKGDIQTLYLSSTRSFKGMKKEESTVNDNGDTEYETELCIHGANRCFITVDDEKSHTYTAQLTFKNVLKPMDKMEEIIGLVNEITSQYGLARGKTTDIKYKGYQKHTLEFPSDNINEMGRRPTLGVGMLKDGNPMEIEITITEPLWK